MTWLTPALAAIAAAIAVPTLVLLYFLKLRRRDVEVSSTLLWKKSIQDMQANAPFQRLRRNILLFLQLLALAAALVAIAQPMLAGETATGVRHVILIDRSASMATLDETEDGQPSSPAVTRLQRAQQLALELVDTLREPNLLARTQGRQGDQAMVIVYDTAAQALQTFTADKDALRRAIRSIEPTDAPTSVVDAFRLVRAQAPRRVYQDERTGGTLHERPAGPVGTIHLFTDGRLPDAARAELSPEDVVIYHKVGRPDTPNLAITSIRATRALEDPRRLSIFTGLQSTETVPRRVQLELQIDGQVVDARAIDLPAATVPTAIAPSAIAPTAPAGGSDQPVPSRPVPVADGAVFTLDRPQGGIISVQLISPAADKLKNDDRAAIITPPSKALAVAVVSPAGNLFIREALAGMTLAKLDTLTPEQFQAHLDLVARNQATPYDVVILDGVLPQPPAASPVPGEPDPAPLPPGRYLIFNAVPPGPLGLVEKSQAQNNIILDWARDHPALRDLTLEPLVIAKSRALEVPRSAAARVLASTDAGPAIVELSMPAARAIVVAFDPLDTNWPFETSWVLFLVQSVLHLGDDSALTGQSLVPGGRLADRVPPGAADLQVRLPDGSTEPVGEPDPQGQIVYAPVLRAGVYQLSWLGSPGPTDARQGDRAVRPFAANLLDPFESDLASEPTIALTTTVARAQDDAAQARGDIPLWPFLLLGMVLLLLLEWFIYNRKVQL